MGRKTKAGKQRKDKFYRLAKETGVAFEKLVKPLYHERENRDEITADRYIDQLREPIRKVITFQEDIRSDKCKQTQISNRVDRLDPTDRRMNLNSNVRNTENSELHRYCQNMYNSNINKSLIKKELHTWKADCVLNDGSPNVGSAWIQDAFSQAQLTLSALKLACEFLREGGWFITKVFRSKDYQPLLWVFQQLFKKVHSTKPQASRSESAEIFVVCQKLELHSAITSYDSCISLVLCNFPRASITHWTNANHEPIVKYTQGYIAPAKIDPKFLDPKHIFSEVEPEGKKTVSLLKLQKGKKAKAEGYTQGDYTLFQTAKVTDFLQVKHPLEVLSAVNEIVFDEEKYSKHVKTTDDIKECCKDVKVLGKTELKSLLAWHKTLRKEFIEVENEDASTQENGETQENEEEKLDKMIEGIEEEEKTRIKREKKKVRELRRKLQERMTLKNMLPGDQGNLEQDRTVFSLTNIKSKQHLDGMENPDNDETLEFEDDEEADENDELESDSASEYSDNDDENGMDDSEDDEELEFDSDNDEVELTRDEDAGEKNPLLVDLQPEMTPSARANMWFEKQNTYARPLSHVIIYAERFSNDCAKLKAKAIPPTNHNRSKQRDEPIRIPSNNLQLAQSAGKIHAYKDVFKDLENEADEDLEISQMVEEYKKQGGKILGKNSETPSAIKKKGTKRGKKEEGKKMKKVRIDEREGSDSDSDSESESGRVAESAEETSNKRKKKEKVKKLNGFEVVPAEDNGKAKTAAAKYLKKLTPEGLALGHKMAFSRKDRSDIIDDGYHRWTFNDEGLPDWFVSEEARHYQKELPVTKEMVAEYRARMREINARPIKKVAEAKARKKRREMKALEKARKKAEAICDTVDISEKEKMSQIQSLYKKALLKGKPKEVKYVVARKFNAARRMKRPPGIKGRYKVVDPRMKKDMRSQKLKEKKSKKGGKKRR
ncbi:pre-rRNA 2'-O-ribose RNA methyltransferase FTSJ3 [Acropora cervicornis]|uniref:Pre-rRNA 2'-O-ribose RNA methyltransferase FTSJ3 n=1 Tax=Acropora cervicornis TaxID=6130 RepID=A0AAD9QJG2_ACRCE|nr:pre-rRNA 2'-O-ribose RNA methyltransferase FTSJ3 [Acropora cervicornis]